MKKRLHYKYFFFSTIIFFSLLFFLYAGVEKARYDLLSRKEITAARKQLKVLSRAEKDDLDSLFQWALTIAPYPYTLVGNKPLSIDYFVVTDRIHLASPRQQRRYKLRRVAAEIAARERGWHTWCKYTHLHPTKTFKIIPSEEARVPYITGFFLFHLAHCREIIAQHLEIFQKTLHAPLTAEEILSLLLTPNDPQANILFNNEVTLGILLGFGKENALLYADPKKRRELSHFSKSSLQNWIHWNYWPIGWSLPLFVCDPLSQETLRLQESYKRTQKVIFWTYLGRNRLEVTLALLELDPLVKEERLSQMFVPP